MANRAYLYSLSNCPRSYADRPVTVTGLSEWPYAIPFSYCLLMSGDPQLCSSLISDGFGDEPQGQKTKLFAISSDFERGFARMEHFSFVVGLFAATTAPHLVSQLEHSCAFLREHRDRHLLLETIELDIMDTAEESVLRACVEQEIARCRAAGAAVDALSPNPVVAVRQLQAVVEGRATPAFDAFHGLRFDDDFDNTREGRAEQPLGLVWYDVLYFKLLNRAEFDART